MPKLIINVLVYFFFFLCFLTPVLLIFSIVKLRNNVKSAGYWVLFAFCILFIVIELLIIGMYRVWE